MIETYQESGDKDWLEATVTIDGETYENVGMRLKGNSSIMALGGRGPAQFMGPGGGNARTDTSETTTVAIHRHGGGHQRRQHVDHHH